ncbi:MAG: hypothetical protein Q8S19_02980, partial [Bacillota bacterium]|nr:hypothetical protein [Bacillota bacterium]
KQKAKNKNQSVGAIRYPLTAFRTNHYSLITKHKGNGWADKQKSKSKDQRERPMSVHLPRNKELGTTYAILATEN